MARSAKSTTSKRDRGGTTSASGRRKRVTIRDVAAAAEVSPMTVSNVINGKFRFVSDETRQRVVRTIKQLDYRLLSSGRNLRLGSRQAVGVIIVDESPNFLSHPYISRMVSGLCGTLNANGYAMIVQGITPPEFANTLALHRAEADAYCVRLHGSTEQRSEMLELVARLGAPIALVQETLLPPSDDMCVVRQDDFSGGRMMADHLAARQVNRMWVVVPRFSGPMTEARLGGLRDGFRAAKRAVEIERIVSENGTFADTYDTICNRLASGEAPDAILGINDELALASLRALQDRSLRIPRDVLVAGFNGFNPQSYSRPALTTVVSCPTEIGANAADAVLHHLAHGQFAMSQVVLPVTLRTGRST